MDVQNVKVARHGVNGHRLGSYLSTACLPNVAFCRSNIRRFDSMSPCPVLSKNRRRNQPP